MTYVAVQPWSEPRPNQRRAEAVRRYFAAIQDGNADELLELLTPDALTRWPQSGERITGALSCVTVHTSYPGGPPQHSIVRVSGGGDVWVVELTADYGDERWYLVSVIEFDGERIARMTDYFGPRFPAAEWRKDWVELETADA
jgi:hypothetical protein